MDRYAEVSREPSPPTGQVMVLYVQLGMTQGFRPRPWRVIQDSVPPRQALIQLGPAVAPCFLKGPTETKRIFGPAVYSGHEDHSPPIP